MAIVIRRVDGGVSVMTLLGDALEAATLAPDQIDVIVEAEIAQWAPDARDAVVAWNFVPDDEIPNDRSMRAELLTKLWPSP